MSGAYDIDLMHEIQEEVTRELVEEFRELIQDSLGPDGETYGDTQMAPGDRIAQFLIDAQSGQLDMLQYIAPQFAQKRAKQYLEDMKHSPFIAHTFEGDNKP